MDRFADDGKLGQGFTSVNDLVEVDIGNCKCNKAHCGFWC